MLDPALALVAEVARALGELRSRVVFIGGAISPLLQTKPPFPAARPTTDVDGIAVTASYVDFESLRRRLREQGFRESMDASHAHRWVSPGGRSVDFDLVPVGHYFGASGNPWDEATLDSAVETEIEPGLFVRHASAPAFLALKLAAFRDRGSNEPFWSTDLEDVFALLASRPGIVGEVDAAPAVVREFIAGWARRLAAADGIGDLLAAHLGNVARGSARDVIGGVERTLAELGALGAHPES